MNLHSEESTSYNYREYHEKFMENHNGTSSVETVMVLMSAPAGVLLLNLTTHIVGSLVYFKTIKMWFCFALEYVLFILPLVLVFTVWSNIAHWVVLTIIFHCLCIILMHESQILLHVKFKDWLTLPINETKKPFVTNFRASINLATALCILAVDFKVFPRRFAKTETYGYGFMDTGVGGFIFANAIVSSETQRSGKRPLKTIFSSTFLSTTPLFLLGGLRFFTIQQLDYQQHISEYGVHWNFFITLALNKIFCTLILSFIDSKFSILISLIIISIHETLLNCGMKDWVFGETPRINFLSSNREGITSSLGYIALYLAGVHVGRLLNVKEPLLKSYLITGLKLIGMSITLWTCTALIEPRFGISRRLANLGFYLWMFAYNLTFLSTYLAVELVTHLFELSYKNNKGTSQSMVTHVPSILEAISYNGLTFFLVANVLTGLVNMSIQTFHVETFISILILNGYMFITCLIIFVLYLKKIKLKVW